MKKRPSVGNQPPLAGGPGWKAIPGLAALNGRTSAWPMRRLFPRRRRGRRGHRAVRVRPAPAAARSRGASRDLALLVTRLVRTLLLPSHHGRPPRPCPPSGHVRVPRGRRMQEHLHRRHSKWFYLYRIIASCKVQDHTDDAVWRPMKLNSSIRQSSC